MPLAQFTDEAYEGLAAGSEEVAVGDAGTWYEKIETPRRDVFQAMIKAMSARYR